MRAADRLAIMVVMVAAGPVSAAPRVSVDIAAGTLGEAAIRLAQQANVTIGVTDSLLVRLPTPAVHGRMDVDLALARLLHGLPARAERVDRESWRIVAAKPAVADHPMETASRKAALSRTPPINDSDVVVMGSKTGTRFDRYAGTAIVTAGNDLTLGERETGSDALVQRLPTFGSTHLGSGRNKLFIRGVADSSFNGPSQALVGEYLGDVRLNYNAPDPDLSLYDVRAVEVIEGPQGTLYGAGALGGIVRIVPEPVDMTHRDAAIAYDGALTAHGDPGYDGVALVNLPIQSGRLALRALVFRSVEGGYINDAQRDLSRINGTVKNGGRATLAFRPGQWRIEVGLVEQDVSSADGQYAQRGAPPLTRSNRVAQPFDNDYLLAHVTVARDWGSTSFLSASSFVQQRVNSRFDFTPDGLANPRIYDQDNHIDLFNNETRVSRQDREGRGWVVGASLLHDQEDLTRAIGAPASPIRILGVSNSVTEGSIFGEAGIGLLPSVIATVGARFEYAHLVGQPLDRRVRVGEPRRDEAALLPSLSLSWQVNSRLMLFARYQEGLRPGGLSVIPGQGGPPTVQRFHGDSLSSIEGGVKLLPDAGGALRATMTLSYAHWENIQADLIDMRGLPYTANVGTGRIWGAEASLQWRPARGLGLTAALFANDSQMDDAQPTVRGAQRQEFPNVPHLGASAKADLHRPLGGDWQIDLATWARYTGRSRLGPRPNLYIAQGNYVVSNASARVGTDRWGLSLQADNLFDDRGNMFALGNPFGVALGDQIVPPRPRTFRIGVDARF